MMCKIGDYTIEGKWIDNIDESLDLKFAEINRVNNNPYYQNIGKFKEVFKIKGEFVKQKIYILDKDKHIIMKDIGADQLEDVMKVYLK